MKSNYLQSFLSRSLEKILKEKDIKKSHHSELRTCCENVLEDLKNDSEIMDEDSGKSPSPLPSALPLPPSSTPEVIPEHYFLPFEKACSAKSPKIICTALDCLQKLIAYGHLSNNISCSTGNTRLINRLVEAICSCFTGPSTDEGVQLQIIKVLLTIVTSPHISVHEGTVLLTIRTVYNIYLASKSSINSTTAKGTLSQMLNVIYTRMETEEDSPKVDTEELSTTNETEVENDCKTTPDQKEEIPEQISPSSMEIDMHKNSVETHSETEEVRISNEQENVIVSETVRENGLDTSENELKLNGEADEVEDVSDADKKCKFSLENSESIEFEGPLGDKLHEPEISATECSTEETTNDKSGETETLDVVENGGVNTEHMHEEFAGNSSICTPISPDNPFEENDLQPVAEEGMDEVVENGLPIETNHSQTNSQEESQHASHIVEANDHPEPLRSRVESQESLVSTNLSQTLTDSSSHILVINNTTPVVPSSVPSFNHILQKDAFLIFRALCKLSMKPLPDNGPGDPRSHELRSKVLSLQLLLSIVSDPGQVFKTNPVFITAIKQYLCISLIKNGLNLVPEVFELSMKIFVQLLVHFRPHLRSQVEVFFKDIIFHILEQSTQISHKAITLNSLISICSNAQIIVDLYLNYDCDLGSVNIFERLVNDLSRIATDSTELRIAGIRGLVGILQCMDEWSRPKEDVEEIVEDNPVQFEVMKSHKNTWEQGLFLFNRKPGDGLKFLQANNLLGTTAEEIAIFFHTDERVDKVGIGEYLGDPEVFHKQVMYAYVDQFNFKDQDFVTALRHFLEGFRLPGEAQKIDRLMEKFASRYCECNPTNGIFTSADTAYVLAYSIIMLTTDLHSPQVKTKMTKEQYIRMNRGINDSRDLPEVYLSSIYDEIAGNEIKMKNVPKKSIGKNLFGFSSNREEQNFTEGKHLEHIRPMFKLAWTPFLASFSVGLQDSNAQNISSLCLEGMRLAIHIACIFQMRMERDAYIQALARFTLLNTSSLTEMKSKNINSIKTLITIGQLEGNYLDTAWLDILKVISSLELAQLVGTRSKEMTTGGLGSLKTWTLTEPQQPQNPLMINLNHLDPSVKESITSTSSQSILVAVDRIFTVSTLLDGDSIVYFVRALCTVSLDELISSHPRMFSLQKIVEISYYNMSRIRLEWSRIWEVLGDHFNHVGCLSDEIAFFAIDSLRQLSMKFIEKGEFTNFRFQKDFLRPFEYIMKKNKSPSIRDMIVRCITQMIHQSGKIRSGWKNIFSVLSLGANDVDPNIVEMCFTTTNKIISELYSTNPTILMDSFQDGIKCLSEFACNTNYPDISMESIRLIRYCGNFVDQTPDLLIECMDELSIPQNDRIWVRGWFPILFELSCIISRCNLDVRTRGLTVMFEIMKTYGAGFQPHWWKDLFQVIFRIFDNMKLPEQLNEVSYFVAKYGILNLSNVHISKKTEWMTTTCNHALFAIIDVFTQFYDVLGPLLMGDLFKQLQWCIEGDPTCQLSTSAIHCFEHLVLSNGSKFNKSVWNATMEFLRGISKWMVQRSHLAPIISKKAIKQCNVSNELVLTIDNIVFYQTNGSRNGDETASPNYEQEQGMYPCLSDENLVAILDTLACFGETEEPLQVALNTSLRLLFRIYSDQLRAGIHHEIEERLLSLNTRILQNPQWVGLLSLTLQRLTQLGNDKFKIHTTIYYTYLCELVGMDLEPELKRLLKIYFLRIGSIYCI